MTRFALIVAALALAAPAASAQMLPISGHVLDGNTPLALGSISFTPTRCNGQATQFSLAGVGAFSADPFIFKIKDSLFAGALPDTSLTTPHICFAAMAVNTETGYVVLRTGYSFMQPAPGVSWCPLVNGVPACNFDAYPATTAYAAPPPTQTGPGSQGPKGDPGAPGPAGPQGTPGSPGPQGLPGLQGEAGLRGAAGLPATVAIGTVATAGPGSPASVVNTGNPSSALLSFTLPQGLPGIPGVQGPQGVQGQVGQTGATGATGVKGDPGIAGAPGQAGSQGVAGTPGAIGPAGPQGATGATGAASTIPGPPGPSGQTGATGQAGAQGVQGLTGPAGPMGAQGPQGLAGVQGTVGPPGPVGQTGANGAAGVAGATGPLGPQGATGATGAASTVPGPAGATGPVGPQGAAGPTGAASTVPGPAGANGPPGATGPAGPTGPQGPVGPGGGASDGTIVANASTNTIAQADTAANQVIAVGPNYGAVDPAHLFPTHSGSSIRYTLPGLEGIHYNNCAFQQKPFLLAYQNLCASDHVDFSTQLSGNQAYRHASMNVTGASTNFSSGWRISTLLDFSVVNAARGIGNGINFVYRSNAAGDKNVFNIYHYMDGGAQTQSDERIVTARFITEQNDAYYHGTSLSSGTAGVVTVPLLSDSTVSSHLPYADANHTTDGGILLDLSNPQISGTVTGPAVPVPGSAYLMQFPTDANGSLPIATAYASCPGTIPYNGTPQGYASWSCTVSLKSGAFVVGHHVWITKRYPEEATVTAAGAVSNGTQAVTFSVRNPQPCADTSYGTCPAGEPPIEIVQDSTMGYYFSPDYNMTYGAPRSTYYAFGSLDGTNLIVGFYLTGSPAPIPTCGAAPWCPGATGKNGFHLIKGAEVIANLSTHHDPVLATHSIVFAQGDAIEAPPPVAFGMTAVKIVCGQNTPTNGGGSQCHYINVGGPGASANYVPDELSNSNDPTMYFQNGGSLTGMTAHHTGGYFDFGYGVDIWPGLGAIHISNMTYNQHQGGTKTLWALPSDNILWDDTNHIFYSTVLGSQFYRGPAITPSGSCPTSQSGWVGIGQDGHMRTCIVASGGATPPTTGTWTDFVSATANALAATPTKCPTGQAPTGVDAQGNAVGCAASSGTGGGGTASAVTGLRLGNGTGPDTAAAASDVEALLATDLRPTSITYSPGINGHASDAIPTPGAGKLTTGQCTTSPGVYLLDANGYPQLCIYKPDGSQIIIAGPPPPLTYAAIHAACVTSDPNCNNPSSDCSKWLNTGHCQLPPGSVPQPAGSAVTSNNFGGGSALSLAYSNIASGALDVVVAITKQTANTSSISPPVVITSSSGITGTLLASATDPTGAYPYVAYGFPQSPAGSQTFTVSGSTTLQMVVAEVDGVNASTPYESAGILTTASQSGVTCPTITTTGTNELAVNILFGFQQVFTSTSGYTTLPGSNASQFMIFTNNLPAAATQHPAYTTPGSQNQNCFSLAVRP